MKMTSVLTVLGEYFVIIPKEFKFKSSGSFSTLGFVEMVTLLIAVVLFKGLILRIEG